MPREKELARTPQLENLKNQLSKLGNTPFEAESVEIVLSDNWFIPSSELSDLRRRAVENCWKPAVSIIRGKYGVCLKLIMLFRLRN